MTTNNKMTKREKFEALLCLPDVQTNQVLYDFVKHELELLEKKNASKKPTEKQTANEEFKKEIFEIVKNSPNQLFTITDLLKQLNDPELTNQRVSAIVRQMYDSKETGEIYPLIRVEEKRKAYFKLNPNYIVED